MQFGSGIGRKLSSINAPSIEVVQQFPGLVEAMERGKTAKKICRSAGVPVFCYHILSEIDDEAASLFFHRFVTGEKSLVAGNYLSSFFGDKLIPTSGSLRRTR